MASASSGIGSFTGGNVNGGTPVDRSMLYVAGAAALLLIVYLLKK